MTPKIEEYRNSYGGLATRVLSVDGAGPPFVLLHGYSDSADTWRAVLRELGRAGRAALAVDLPGFGRAARSQPGPLLPQVDRFTADLVKECGQQGPVVLAGNSLGAVAALRAAQDDSLPVAGIVPIAPAGLGHAAWVNRIAHDPILHRLASVPLPLPRAVFARAIGLAFSRLALARPSAVEPGAIERFASHFVDARDVRRTVTGAFSLLRELNQPYELTRIQCPVLLVWGAHDRLVPRLGAETILETVTDSRLVVLDDCGHCPQLEDPAAISGLLVKFSARVAPVAAGA